MVFCCLAALHSAGVSLYGGLQNKKTAVPQAGMAADPWESLRFLVGEWVGVEGTGQPGEAISGGTSFAFDLGDKILVRKNRADYAPKPGEQTGISHQDLLILYQLTGETEIRGFYVDNEGHAINYLVTSPGKGKAVFESAESKTGPRYRLDYELNADRALTITFSIAMPGTTYTVYTRGTAHRK
jgi:hypothetical protein